MNRMMRAVSPVRGYDRIKADLEEQLPYVADDIGFFRGAHLFMTGGTGFVGRWFLESLLHANKRLTLAIKVSVITRDPLSFVREFPHLGNNEAVTLIQGDVLALPENLGCFDGFIHAATPASAQLNREAPLTMLTTIINGGQATLELAARSGQVPFLFTSSGAIYGRQPTELLNTPESWHGAPDTLNPASAYHEGKRLGELQCAIYGASSRLQIKLARLFAFVGPYLPLDRHFAVGNFIRDALAGQPIRIQGDGKTIRSYQYAAEMVTWLWAIFARGQHCRAYNVGSEHAITIAELAHCVAESVETPPSVSILGSTQPGLGPDRYVPSTQRITSELKVRSTISTTEAIARTLDFAYGKVS